MPRLGAKRVGGGRPLIASTLQITAETILLLEQPSEEGRGLAGFATGNLDGFPRMALQHHTVAQQPSMLDIYRVRARRDDK